MTGRTGLRSVDGLLVGGIADVVNGFLSLVAVTAAAATGAARYGAVLRGSDRDRVERATAVGFYAGALLGAVLLAVDRVLT